MTGNRVGIRDIPIGSKADDSLGLERYARALGEFILHCDTPITVGIQGDWGSGKTSLMNIVKEYVHGNGKVIPIWLNTWQYAQLSDPELLPLVLLQALHRKAAKDAKNLAKLWAGLSASVGKVKGLSLGGFGVEIGDGDAAGDVDLEALKSSFAAEVKARLAAERMDRLVVFVDDLDRVLPARAVEILEVLKNFVDVEGCVFVIACDYEVVVKGLKEKFHVGEQDLGGRSFFDKIIQVPFRMPVLHYQVEQYVQGILHRIGWDVSTKDVEDYRVLLEHSVGFNPRSVKRLCNNLLLLKNVAEGGLAGEQRAMLDDARRQKILFGLVCLEFSFEPVYRALHRLAEDSALSNLLLTPGDVLRDDSVELEYDDGELDPIQSRLEGFLQALGRIVDDNHDGTLSASELEVLQEMMTLSSITSVADESKPKRKKQSSTQAELMAMARQSGYLDRFETLRGRLRRVTKSHKGLRERKSVRFFGYSMDAVLAGADKPGWWTILRLYAVGSEAGLRVTLFHNRILDANPGPERRDACERLMRFVEDQGEWQGAESRGYEHYDVVLESDEDAETLWGLLARLIPFQVPAHTPAG